MDAPTLTVRAIKTILKRENDQTFSEIINAVYTHARDVAQELRREMNDKIDKIETYQDADNFIGLYYRMSLNDWAQSL